MNVNIRIQITDEQRKELAKKLGRKGLARREDVRDTINSLWAVFLAKKSEDE